VQTFLDVAAQTYGGYIRLYQPDRRPGPIIDALCCSHAAAQVLRTRAKLSRHDAVAKAIDYMVTRWPSFTRFPEMAASIWAGRLQR
jgi:hypothetical protein